MLNFEEIVSWILQQTDGNLSAAGERELIENFRHAVYYSDRWKVQGTKLVINNFYLKCQYSTRQALAGHQEKRSQVLLKALSYWCTRSLTVMPALLDIWPQTSEDRHKVYMSGNLDLRLPEVIALNFFLNNRLDIVFPTAAQAHKFAEMFELHTLEERSMR